MTILDALMPASPGALLPRSDYYLKLAQRFWVGGHHILTGTSIFAISAKYFFAAVAVLVVVPWKLMIVMHEIVDNASLCGFRVLYTRQKPVTVPDALRFAIR